MPSDYEKICEDNIRRRGEEFDDIGRLISERLYSDRSHFIYELLQNAEDALERRVKQYPDENDRCGVQFRLFRNGLEFRHFGALFNENDVEGISDVLKGTKTEDLGQIGKFGIGFKSVYAFTASPEIHSGDEHFVISRYIRPKEKIPDSDLEMEDDETVFIFPFDRADMPENEAFDLISSKLRELDPRVLLFLKRIDKIEWYVDANEEKGQYRKRDGNYYFEAVEAFSNDYFSKEHTAQYLALCPLCAAMYKEFVKRDETAMKGLHDTLKNLDKHTVPLQLGELKTSIRFVETHFLDIRAILKF